MSFTQHADVLSKTTETKSIEGKLPMRIPAPTDARWGSRQVRDISRPKHRAPGYDRVAKLLDRLRCCGTLTAAFLRNHHYAGRVTVGYFYGRGTVSVTAVVGEVGQEWWRPVVERLQYNCEMNIRDLHPAVQEALKLAKPRSVRVLLMHLPRPSKEAKDALIFNQSYDKLCRALYTRTSPGKYLREHFPSLTDTEIRDIVALTCTNGEFGINWDLANMINTVEDGPTSCMKGYGAYEHPYRVYDPALGWGMAFKKSTAYEMDTAHAPKYFSRALVNSSSMTFVRSYKFGGVGNYSHACEALEAWLATQGYKKAGGWRGLKLKRLPADQYDNSFVMPYVDGEQSIYEGSVDYFTVGATAETPNYIGLGNSTSGELALDNDDDEDLSSCEDCDESYPTNDDDAWRWAGVDESRRICCHCCDTEYVYGYGRGGNQYYFREDVAVYCDADGEHYHRSYLSDNDIVRCYATDDYFPEADAYRCAYSNNWYNDEECHVKLPNGDAVHNINVADYFEDNPEEFVEWWANGCKEAGGDGDIDIDEVAQQFVDGVNDDEIELNGLRDWLVYRACCVHVGDEPQLPRAADDEEETEETN
jgi:hypothetical protein